MDVFVARQPIFDRSKKIYAYELLFRSGTTNCFPNIDGNTATTSLLSTSFFTIGIDKITGGKLAFINFTSDLIADGTPHLFSSEKMLVEILENVEPKPEIIESCMILKNKGYNIALDDFVYSRKMNKLLELCDIVKIDVRYTPQEKVEEMVSALKSYRCRLLAEKVETYADFARAHAMGFNYFQGYFFSRPEMMKNKDFTTSQITMIRLLAQINTAEFDVAALGELVGHDVSLSYKLFNYLNSAYFGRLQPITSIKQAISYLGENGFRLFVSLIATSLLAEKKPDALVKTAVIRARFLYLVGLELKTDPNEMFLLGLFSLIDAMLDRDMREILQQLPLTADIVSALLEHSGKLYVFLRLIETYETGNWIAFHYAHKRSGIESGKLLDFYVEAIAWAESLE
jgi:c-di-GMP-related signal transduction protein